MGTESFLVGRITAYSPAVASTIEDFPVSDCGVKGFIGDWGLFKEKGNIVADEPVGVARGGDAGVLAKLSAFRLPLSGKKLGAFAGLLPA